MKNLGFLSIIFTIFLMTSCSRNLNYFTENIYAANKWSEDELKQIQFYLSEDIRLVREFETGSSDIESGKIKIKDQQELDEVIIKKGTPGVLVFSPNEDRFALSFDNDPSKYLMFGPNEKAKGRYVLLAKKWKKRGGIISYGGEQYRTNSKSAYAALMVDISKASKVTRNSDTASGRKIKS